MHEGKDFKNPDLAQGVAKSDLADGEKLLGHVGADAVLLVRYGDDFFAVAPECTHYHGPLADGVIADGAIRCPWHHACFDLRTGEAVRAPAFSPIACWEIEHREDKVFVQVKREAPEPKARPKLPSTAPAKIVIVGGGAAGFAAAEMLRRQQFDGSIVLLSNDAALPVDRPNLSKDYLAGAVPEDWVFLRPDNFYGDNAIDLRLTEEVAAIDIRSREVTLSNGNSIGYDRLLLATGAEPVRLWIPGGNESHVHSLRSLADCRSIIASAQGAARAVILGASFIGLEVAAALRVRGIEVHVVAPEKLPMERVLGREMGRFVQSLHEGHGVVFHLNETAVSITQDQVTLKSDRRLAADFVVAGIGVRPRIDLAAKAGLLVERGVVVNSFLETSATGVYAAGDIARWPDKHSGANIRVEHWVVAERQGQTVALNMMGHREPFAAVPYFWSQHYDVPINYVGHAERWDEIAIEGDIATKDCVIRYKQEGRTRAIASIFRDRESLQAEISMERQTNF
ncbi:FAD-dependent oxidoreductase [Pseudorhodoplanes sp.]|uniref:FAD-dependent oxidoreductase n=1 Tax=Pseudorhodoplanes sp. TaxID=1934341 RepID=UPI003D0F820D